mgnify:CR=1 FL=1
MNYNKAVFENAYGVLSQLPESDEPEVDFLQVGQMLAKVHF